MGPKSLFWLGSAFKTNSNIRVLELTRCNIDNDCLYMFVEGTKYKNENLNNEQLNLDRLNLKETKMTIFCEDNFFYTVYSFKENGIYNIKMKYQL